MSAPVSLEGCNSLPWSDTSQFPLANRTLGSISRRSAAALAEQVRRVSCQRRQVGECEQSALDVGPLLWYAVIP